MEIALYIILVTTLLLVVYQDLKMRRIHVLLPIITLILNIFLKWEYIEYWQVGLTILFLITNFLVITFYYSLKKRAWINPFDTLIGWGDVLFLIALAPLFSFRNYIVFFIMGTVFSLIFYVIIKSIYPIEKTIPFAGYLSIFIIGIMGINFFAKNNFLLL